MNTVQNENNARERLYVDQYLCYVCVVFLNTPKKGVGN